MAAATQLLLSLAFWFLFVEAPVDGPDCLVEKMSRNTEDCDGVSYRPDFKWKRVQLPASRSKENNLTAQIIRYGGSAFGIAYYTPWF